MFIAIDGVDGTGKTTLARTLANQIGGVYYKSPPPCFAEAKAYIDLNFDARSRFYFYLSIVQHDSQAISKYIAEGRTVVCDRYVASVYAYHVAMDETLAGLCNFSTLLRPDLQILLTASAKTRSRRLVDREASGKPSTVMDTRSDFLSKVQDIYREYPAFEIDTSELTVAEVFDAALNAVKSHRK